MISIENKAAVVTGAGRGIGRAIAIELSRLGARVALAARSQQDLEQTAAVAGTNARAFATDVRSKQQVHALLDRAAAEFGPVDILVNAAGVGLFTPVAECSDDDFATVFETNLRGIFFACRHVLPSMIERQSGHIVNIASIAGKVGSANRAVYCASKFGLVGFSESLAEEVRQHGVRVSVICPGSTATTFSSSRVEKPKDNMLRPEDVAAAVRMIVTQEANSFISEIVMRPTRKA